MRKLVLLIVMAVSVCSVCHARGGKFSLPEEEVKADAERGFCEIFELWHGKKYDELYERTHSSGRQTRKAFAGRLAAAPLSPACCWQQVQDLRVTVKNDDNAIVRAKIGLEGRGDIEYRSRSFKLRREDGIWRISLSDILSLAGASKKKGYTGTIR